MGIQNALESKLATFNPQYLEALNESSSHSGTASDSHFKITIVSDDFINMKLLERSRKINKLCEDEISAIHAFSVFAYTVKEWEGKQGSPLSPKCGGS